MKQRFSDLEMDALTELVNIGVSGAAASLSRVVRDEVLLSVPALSIASAAQAASLLAGSGGRAILAVRQAFDGEISGQAVLLFPEADSLALSDLIADQLAAAEPEADLRADALRETGNIVLQSCLSSIANLLQRTLHLGQPEVLRTTPDALVTNADDVALLIYMTFQVRQQQVRGYVALLMDLVSMDGLRNLVAEFIDRARAQP